MNSTTPTAMVCVSIISITIANIYVHLQPNCSAHVRRSRRMQLTGCAMPRLRLRLLRKSVIRARRLYTSSQTAHQPASRRASIANQPIGPVFFRSLVNSQRTRARVLGFPRFRARVAQRCDRDRCERAMRLRRPFVQPNKHTHTRNTREQTARRRAAPASHVARRWASSAQCAQISASRARVRSTNSTPLCFASLRRISLCRTVRPASRASTKPQQRVWGGHRFFETIVVRAKWLCLHARVCRYIFTHDFVKTLALLEPVRDRPGPA